MRRASSVLSLLFGPGLMGPVALVGLVALAGLAAMGAPANASTADASNASQAVAAATRHTYYDYFDPTGATITAGAGHVGPGGYTLNSDGHVDISGVTTQATTRIDLLLTTTQCQGPPRVVVSVDGVAYLGRQVAYTGTYAVAGQWAPGPHTVRIRLTDQLTTATCHRSLNGPGPAFYGYDDGSTYVLPVSQFANLQYATVSPSVSWNGQYQDAAVRGDTTFSVGLDSQGARQLQVNSWTNSCDGSLAHVRIALDGNVLYDGPTGSGNDDSQYMRFPVRPANGSHVISVTISGLPAATDDCTPEVELSGFYFTGYV